MLTRGLKRILDYYLAHKDSSVADLAKALGQKPTSLARQMGWLAKGRHIPVEEYRRLAKEARALENKRLPEHGTEKRSYRASIKKATGRRDRMEVSVVSGDEIVSLDELLDAANVDRAVWEVVSQNIQKHADGRYTLRATLKRTTHTAELLAMRDAIFREIRRTFRVKNTAKAPRTRSGVMLEVSIPDIHIGKLAWDESTGDENWDVDIAAERFLGACTELITRARRQEKIERILLPIGNDFLNSDGADLETTSGTRISEDSRYQRTWRRARETAIEAILMAREVAPVLVIIVPGNHDRERIFYFGDVIHERFYNDKRVEVDNSPMLRKYVRWGKVLLGFTHGSAEKLTDLPMIMMSEADRRWLAETTWREWHIGHLHKKKELKFMPLDELSGVRIRILPSLCAADEWHAMHGYRHNKASEAYLWHKEECYMGHLSVNRD